MKSFILPLLFAAVFLFSCNDKVESSEVPEAVRASFMLKYPNATEVEWEMDHDNYEAEFLLNNEKMAAEFHADGTFIKEE